MDKDLSDEGSRSSSDYVVDIIPFTKKTLIFGLYSKLNEFERHFEIISTRYKNITLTWLLGCFGGIGFLFSRETSDLVFPHFIAVAIVGFIGLIGVSLIGNMDMNVYHRFWAALFVEELILEERNPFLLQSRKITLLIDESKERLFSQGLLYLVANLILIITIEVSLIYQFARDSIIAIVISSTISVLLFFISWITMRNNNANIIVTLHNLIDKRFSEEGIVRSVNLYNKAH
jgi:hypothetical protein